MPADEFEPLFRQLATGLVELMDHSVTGGWRTSPSRWRAERLRDDTDRTRLLSLPTRTMLLLGPSLEKRGIDPVSAERCWRDAARLCAAWSDRHPDYLEPGVLEDIVFAVDYLRDTEELPAARAGLDGVWRALQLFAECIRVTAEPLLVAAGVNESTVKTTYSHWLGTLRDVALASSGAYAAARGDEAQRSIWERDRAHLGRVRGIPNGPRQEAARAQQSRSLESIEPRDVRGGYAQWELVDSRGDIRYRFIVADDLTENEALELELALRVIRSRLDNFLPQRSPGPQATGRGKRSARQMGWLEAASAVMVGSNRFWSVDELVDEISHRGLRDISGNATPQDSLRRTLVHRPGAHAFERDKLGRFRLVE